MPTSRTRAAGLAAMLTPLLLAAGQYLNRTVPSDRGPVHGLGVATLVLAIPAFVFGLWGLRSRHGGLGPLGTAAISGAILSPALVFVPGYGYFAAMGMLGLAVIVLVGQILRAGVLPVMPLVLVAAGPIAALALVVAITAAGRDAGDVWMLPMMLTAVGTVWFGWHLWKEPAVDHPIPPSSAA